MLARGGRQVRWDPGSEEWWEAKDEKTFTEAHMKKETRNVISGGKQIEGTRAVALDKILKENTED